MRYTNPMNEIASFIPKPHAITQATDGIQGLD